MQVQRIDHSSGKGEYIVSSRFGPKVSVTMFGPASLSECETFIAERTIVGITAEESLVAQARDIDGSGSDVASVLDACEVFYMNGTPDEQSGDVESPTGHFYRVDRWVVVTNSQGFKDLHEFESEGEAQEAFRELEDAYVEWDSQDEDA